MHPSMSADHEFTLSSPDADAPVWTDGGVGEESTRTQYLEYLIVGIFLTV